MVPSNKSTQTTIIIIILHHLLQWFFTPPFIFQAFKWLRSCSPTTVYPSYLFSNRVKTKTSAKYGLEAQPRLVDIIAAVPPQYRRALVPKLKAKPIRTASGVRRTHVHVCHYKLKTWSLLAHLSGVKFQTSTSWMFSQLYFVFCIICEERHEHCTRLKVTVIAEIVFGQIILKKGASRNLSHIPYYQFIAKMWFLQNRGTVKIFSAFVADRSGGCDVQTTSMSTHQLHRQHLCVSNKCHLLFAEIILFSVSSYL